MRLLRDKDYQTQIQNDNLLQVVEDDLDLLLQAEQAAQAEMTSYLAQRYQTSKIFADTSEFSIAATYQGKNLIEYTESLFSTGSAYSSSDRIVYDNKIYSAITGSTGVAPDSTGGTLTWTYVTEDKSLYYAKTNETEYSPLTLYAAGALVWFNDVVYTAVSSNKGFYPENSAYWTAGASFSFTGHYPDDTTYWTKGDNRNAQIIMYLIDCTLYHLHSRINPRNIPELRSIRYDGANALQTGGAIGWLKKISKGDITADLPSIIPVQGFSIRWGFNDAKNRNTF